MFQIIAYGMKDQLLPKQRPYVPELLILKDEEQQLYQVEKYGNLDVKLRKYAGSIIDTFEQCNPPVQWKFGHMIAVDQDGIEQFHPSEEEKWRATRAQQLVDNAKQSSDPIQTIAALSTASHLVNLDLSALVRDLTAQKLENESLVDTFKRVKH